MFSVVATAQGQYGGVLRDVGEKFQIRAVEDFSVKWMDTKDHKLIGTLEEMKGSEPVSDDFDVADLAAENEKLAQVVSEQAAQVETIQKEKADLAAENEKLKKQLTAQKGEVTKLQNQLATKEGK